MKIRGTKTEVVKIEVTLDDVLTTLKNIILDKVEMFKKVLELEDMMERRK